MPGRTRLRSSRHSFAPAPGAVTVDNWFIPLDGVNRPDSRPGLRQQKLLAGGQHRTPGQMVGLPELPDAFARVAAVAALRDRPEGVGRLDYVDERRSGAVR